MNSPATEIKENTFEENQDLISITIPNTIKRIGSNAYSGYSNLQDMEYEGSLNDWNNIELGEGWKENTSLMYVNCKDGSVYLGPCVAFTAQQDNSSIGLYKKSYYHTLEYSRDGSNWFNMNTSTNISLNNGDKVYIRGVLRANNIHTESTQFKMSGKIAASGNCNAIWNYQDLNAPLKAYCGSSMFDNCTSLTTAPELPATTLVDHCYYNMFFGCTSLTTAPELPATILANGCYRQMFQNCTSLTTAPELPATTLASWCYTQMFLDCKKLNHIKCLATDISTTDYTPYWVRGVASTGIFVKHPDTTWTTGNSGIPSGWNIENAEI